MRKRLIEALIAVAVEEAVRMFIPVLLPYVWTTILGLLTWEFLKWVQRQTADYIPRISPKLERAIKVTGMVFAIVIIGLYWLLANKISRKLARGASVEVAVNALVDEPNGIVHVQYEATNVGDSAAKRLVYFTTGRMVPMPEDIVAEDHFYQLFEARNKNGILGENTLGIKQKIISRKDFIDLLPSDLKEVQEGKKIFYIFTIFEYMDDVHPRLQTTSCIAYRNNFPALCRSGHNDPPF